MSSFGGSGVDADHAPVRRSVALALDVCLRIRGSRGDRSAGRRGGRFRAPIAIVAAAIALATLGSSRAAAAPAPVTRLGSGASEVWVVRPHGRVRAIVVFGHGWSTPFPWQGFAAWIAHLRARGDIVIYPRYRVSANAPAAAALAAFREGIVTAFRSLGSVHVPIVALGKSFGGSAVFDYAAEARAWGAPAPAAVVSVFPALPVDGMLPSTPLPVRDLVEIFVGDRDTVAGSAGADAFWQWLAGHPAARKRYILVHSRPGFIADHNSAQLSTPIARAVFWRPVDQVIAAAAAASRSS